MDIHKPKHPIQHARDFLLEIFTVTCGILIALGLEGLIVSHREAVLARQTRQDFKAEIADVLNKLDDAQAGAASDETALLSLLRLGEARLKHQNIAAPQPMQGRKFPLLPKAAWDTALATQAMHLLTFQEARALATAYNDEFALNDIVAQARGQWITIAKYGDVMSMSEDDIRRGMGDVRVALSYAASMQAIEAKLEQKFKEAQAAIDAASR